MKYLSLCSGIEAASVAWSPLGWEPVAFSEIEKFPCKLLEYRFPQVPNIGDMTKIDGRKYRGAVDLIVGGTPCQGFSIAGNRGGLSDERSGLALHFVRILSECRPRWILWENVPGAFSTGGRRDFGSFLRALAECGYHLAWRVLDARFFGVPQRRRRIFVVGHSGDWRYPAAVLFEREGLRRASEKGRKSGKSDARLDGSVLASGSEIAKSLNAHGHRLDFETEDFVVSPTLLRMRQGKPGGGKGPLLSPEKSLTLATGNDQILFTGPQVIRRLIPVEYERLQGFPDGWTDIPGASDTARYRAIGNSMAVPVMRWLGERIDKVNRVISS